jgi:formate dehydrogenase major subunit
MRLSRRSFIAGAGAAVGGGFLGSLFGLDLSSSAAHAADVTPQRGTITSTICPYCGCGCGALVTAVDGTIVNIEGDPDHPVNQGALCSKGAAMYQIARNDLRLRTVKYRASGASEWEEKDWDWALTKIAQKLKETRDASFVEKDTEGRTINRTESIACIGGASLDNEECYAYSKLARAMGVVYIEHQARI